MEQFKHNEKASLHSEAELIIVEHLDENQLVKCLLTLGDIQQELYLHEDMLVQKQIYFGK